MMFGEINLMAFRMKNDMKRDNKLTKLIRCRDDKISFVLYSWVIWFWLS